MRELITRGVPLVFVSHNLPAVAELCTRALLIVRGAVVHDGPAAETVQQYRRTVAAARPAAARPESDIWIAGVELLGGAGEPAELFRSGAPLTVRIRYETARPVRAGFAVDVHRDGTYCFGVNTRIDGHDLGLIDGAGAVDLEIDALHLAAGCYTASVGIHRAGGIGSGGGIGVYDVHELAYPFTVSADRDGLGLMALPHGWAHHTGAAREGARPAPVHPFDRTVAVGTSEAPKEVAVR
jgi:hypothetical protein